MSSYFLAFSPIFLIMMLCLASFRGIRAEIVYSQQFMDMFLEPMPVNSEKQCSELGVNVGRLEYRLWTQDGVIVVRCDLFNATQNLSYSILFKIKNDTHSPRSDVVRTCEFPLVTPSANITEIYCEYRHSLPSAGAAVEASISCWVKWTNEYRSESMMSCASDEMLLASPGASRRMTNTTDKKAVLDSVVWNKYWRPPSNDTRRQRIHPSLHYDKYVVILTKITKNENRFSFTQKCKDLEAEVLMYTKLTPRTDITPNTITYNCTLYFYSNYGGKFVVTLTAGNHKGPYNNITLATLETSYTQFDDIVVKKCERTQVDWHKTLRCEATLPIIDLDLGYNIYHCQFERNDYNCTSPYTHFHVLTEPGYVQYLKEEEEKEKEAERIMQEEIKKANKTKQRFVKYNTDRNRSINDRDRLPWNIHPPFGPGTRLNGRQYILIGIGFFGLVMALGFIWGACTTMQGKKADLNDAEPCPCVEDDTSLEDEEAA